jgi:phosphohistidine swiveling domain-containing protein
MPIGIEMNNYDISMGTGGLLFSPGGGIRGNVFMNGNVGIGKTNPTATLDVSGFLNASGVIQAGLNNNRAVELATSNNTAHIDFHSLDARYNDYDSRISSSSGTAGISGRGNLEFEAGQHTFSTIGSTRMRIDRNGNVGIGKTNPTVALDVSGTLSTTGIIKTTNTTASTTTTNGALVVAGGVGIGGTVHIGSSTSNPLLLQSDATNSYIRPTGVSSTLYIGTGATNYLSLSSIGVLRSAGKIIANDEITLNNSAQTLNFGATPNRLAYITNGVDVSGSFDILNQMVGGNIRLGTNNNISTGIQISNTGLLTTSAGITANGGITSTGQITTSNVLNFGNPITTYIQSNINPGCLDIINTSTGATSIIRLGTNNSFSTGITISKTGLLTTSAGITATGLITANGGLTTGAGQVLTSTGTTTLTGATTATGLITANGGLTTGAGQVLTSTGTTILTGATTATGLITANGGLTTGAGKVLTSTGTTILTGATTATGLITANGGLITGAGKVLTSTGTTILTGATTATGLITANGGLITGAGQVLTSTGTTILTGATTATGLITANGGLITGAGQVLTSTGTTTLTGATTATGLITANGEIRLNTLPTIRFGPLAGTTAYITSGATTAGTFDILNQVTGVNSKIRLGTNNSTATGLEISNTGLVTTSAGITAAGLITANGGLTTGAGQVLTSTGTTTLTGATTATGLITANGGLTTGAGQVLTSTGTTTLTGATTATGLITANGGLTTGAGKVLTSTGTTILTGATTATGLITANGGLTTGSVGIGISSPGAILDVSGDIRARGEIQMGADNAFQIKRGVSKTLLIEHFSNPAASVCFINRLAGKKTLVGIDTTNPTTELDVNGTIRATNININGSLFNYVPWTTLANHNGGGGSFSNVIFFSGSTQPGPANLSDTRFVYMYSVVGKVLYINWYYTSSRTPVDGVGVNGEPANTPYYYKFPPGYTTSSVPSFLIPYKTKNTLGTKVGTGRYYVHNVSTHDVNVYYASVNTTPYLLVEVSDGRTHGSRVYEYGWQYYGGAFDAAIPLA